MQKGDEVELTTKATEELPAGSKGVIQAVQVDGQSYHVAFEKQEGVTQVHRDHLKPVGATVGLFMVTDGYGNVLATCRTELEAQRFAKERIQIDPFVGLFISKPYLQIVTKLK